jgi:antitoxin (DNA-binding transcriptional repressor) of toxin-antitoxin stability system
MEEETVPVSQFKATCLALLDKVKRTRKPILVARKGEPLALVGPPNRSSKGRLAGSERFSQVEGLSVTVFLRPLTNGNGKP